jgi:Pyruvate/2-oxoacid:ferredoxin oxidoreductase delta subunit
MLMVGASAVQVCTAAILRGPRVFGKIAKEMGTWLDDHGYSSINDIRDLTIHKLKERRFRTTHLPPTLDLEGCNGCRLCEISCVYHAITVDEGKAHLEEDLCWGCGLCATRCRPRALVMPQDMDS